MAEQLSIILVPHTHWDREWYQTFQQFRVRLVRAIDKLLDILDHDPLFRYFMLDGQTIVLDDYLEVRPDQEEHLKHYTRAGRITVGPWYLQPDEFLVSGEALIRNLQIGLQRASEFGDPMRVGYVPDCFGHIAQLPQILRGCGIDSAVFWRGVGAELEKSEFYWEAPDSTRVLGIHLADPLGYSNARMMPLNPEEFVARVELLSLPLLPKAATNTLLFMNGSDHLEAQEGLPKTIEAANRQLAHVNPEHAKLLAQISTQNGQPGRYESMSVHMGTLPQYIEAVRNYWRQNGQTTSPPLQVVQGEMRSSQFSHLLPSVLSTRMWIKQENTATEHLLEKWVEPLTAWAWKLGQPYPAGLVRLAWRYLLQNHPHDSICGCSIDQVHRENSTRFAQSQQICESLIAQATHQIVAATNTCMQTHTQAHTLHSSHHPIPIVVFNPGPGPCTEAVQAVVQLPGSLRNAMLVDERLTQVPMHVINRWRQERGRMQFPREAAAAALALEGIGGGPGEFIAVAQRTIGTYMNQPENTYVITRMHLEVGHTPGVATLELLIAEQGHASVPEQELYPVEQQVYELLQQEDITMVEVSVVDQARETIEFIATDLPAYGLKTFWLYPRGMHAETPLSSPTPLPPLQHGESAHAPSPFIENEFYRVEAHEHDGTLTVTDKQTGAVFAGLNRFVDGGDVGDLYTYCPPAQDLLVSEPQEPPRIELVSSGPVKATLRINGRWALPVTCTAHRGERSSRTTLCSITSDITLTPGVQRVDIHTQVENKTKDHRLRVFFPVPYAVDSVSAECTFEVRARPVAVPRPDNVTEWAEEPVNTFPQKRFVDVSNGTIGLAVLNRGLPEYEVIREGPAIESGQVALALTLLRCVEWLSRDDLSTRHGHAGPMEHTPEAQCPGHSEFDYALVPHRGDWTAEGASVLHAAQAFNIPPRAIVTDQHEGAQSGRVSLLEVAPPELVVSALKRSNDGNGMLVRVYNPLAYAINASIRPGFACKATFVANLLEEVETNKQLWDAQTGEPLHLEVRAGEILTLLFT